MAVYCSCVGNGKVSFVGLLSIKRNFKKMFAVN